MRKLLDKYNKLLNEQLDVGRTGMEIDQVKRPNTSIVTGSAPAPPPPPSCGSICCNITYGYHCPNPPSTWQGVTQGNGTSAGGTHWDCVTINGNPPLVGDTFRDSTSNNGNAPGNGYVYEILSISLPSSISTPRNFLDDLNCTPPCDPSNLTNAFPSSFGGTGAGFPGFGPGACRACGFLGGGGMGGGSIYINNQQNDPSPNPNFATLGDVCNYIDTNNCC